jgi:hypothetical protein
MQQPFELALFVAIAALALALIGYLVRPYFVARRSARRAGQAGGTRAGLARGEQDPAPDDRRRLASGRRERSEGVAGMSVAGDLVCPACHREYPAGLQFCAHDARELVPAGDPSLRAPASGMTCPACKRSFDGNRRFCSFDGEELVPLTLALGATTAGAAVQIAFIGPPGKICPSCSRRYENEATFCGRDGAELVSVN